MPPRWAVWRARWRAAWRTMLAAVWSSPCHATGCRELPAAVAVIQEACCDRDLVGLRARCCALISSGTLPTTFTRSHGCKLRPHPKLCQAGGVLAQCITHDAINGLGAPAAPHDGSWSSRSAPRACRGGPDERTARLPPRSGAAHREKCRYTNLERTPRQERHG
jgi:hypothetical protein